jgi:four helix bundle protein
MANITEGCGRNGDRELFRFVRIAQGSAAELDSHLTLASDLEMTPENQLIPIQDELGSVRRMLARLVQKLSASRTDSR